VFWPALETAHGHLPLVSALGKVHFGQLGGGVHVHVGDFASGEIHACACGDVR